MMIYKWLLINLLEKSITGTKTNLINKKEKKDHTANVQVRFKKKHENLYK